MVPHRGIVSATTQPVVYVLATTLDGTRTAAHPRYVFARPWLPVPSIQPWATRLRRATAAAMYERLQWPSRGVLCRPVASRS